MNNSRSSSLPWNWLWVTAGCGALLVVWQLAANSMGPLFVATPVDTFHALLNLVGSPDLLGALGQSALRIMLALLLQIILGVSLGIFGGVKPVVDDMFKPVVGVLMAVPPVAVTLFVIFVWGSGPLPVVLTAVLLGTPLLYNGAVAAVQSIDPKWLEMAAVFRVPRAKQWESLLVPATFYELLPSILLAAGLTVRLVIMAEVIIGVDRGVGPALSTARAHLATADIFAWMLVMVLIVVVVEGVLMKLAQRYVLAWQGRG